MTPKTCPTCGGHIDAVNKDCEACRSREQLRLRKKEQEKFIGRLDSEDITDSIKDGIEKTVDFEEQYRKEFSKRFR